MLSIVLNRNWTYPESTHAFSPDERFPEYRYDQISPVRNDVYRAVRNCFAQAGLDRARLGTPDWNPLGELVEIGSRVFVLCNFVQHRRRNERAEDFIAKCTHGSVIRAVIDYLLIAIGESGQVVFGNAPLQSARWEAVLHETGARAVVEFYRSAGQNVEAKDLRLLVAERGLSGNITHWEERDAHQVTLVDLGKTSLLAGLQNDARAKFRVTDYNPDRTDQYHSNGSHNYVISKQLLNADVIFSLPKLKTHQKVGLTCGLKGFVGAIAHKDCLAHHRFGSVQNGGDEYPSDRFGILEATSRFHDSVQRSSSKALGGNLLRAVDRVTRRTIDQLTPVTAGSWYGNDTAWRMALDICKILFYANRSGVLSKSPQRRHLILVDGIVGGEGEGPLSPSAVHAGILLFGDDVALCDWAAARLIGFDPRKLPILNKAFGKAPFVISNVDPVLEPLFFNGRTESLVDVIASNTMPFKPPQGWLGHVEFVKTSHENR